MPTVRVNVSPELLRWALERSRLEREQVTLAFKKLPEWELGTAKPTLKQLEAFAKRTHTPLGYFFLPEPPEEKLPIPDYRTIRNQPVGRPSADLLDTIYACQHRQDWYREHAELNGNEALAFVGSVAERSEVVQAAESIRAALGLDAGRAGGSREDALTRVVERAETIGVLVMRNGVVGNNTHRLLDRNEFRGFALVDPLAPLVFINAADSKSAQIFTLAHELVHVFTGRAGVSDTSPRAMPGEEVERWCNEVAAEFLVPRALFVEVYRRGADLLNETARLARAFNVSTLVVLRRIFDVGGLNRATFWAAYDAELARLSEMEPRGTGGDFHRTEAVRVSPRFARALIASTLEGRTLFREAYRLLGIKKAETFHSFGESLGLVV